MLHADFGRAVSWRRDDATADSTLLINRDGVRIHPVQCIECRWLIAACDKATTQGVVQLFDDALTGCDAGHETHAVRVPWQFLADVKKDVFFGVKFNTAHAHHVELMAGMYAA